MSVPNIYVKNLTYEKKQVLAKRISLKFISQWNSERISYIPMKFLYTIFELY